MFGIGEYVVYGNNGVCKITDIGPLYPAGDDEETIDYYTMVPCYIKDSEVSTPVNNTRVVIRAIMTKDEATRFVEGFEKVDLLVVDEEKKRELIYKQTLLSCDPYKIAGMLRGIGKRIVARKAEGKKVTSSDAKYYRMAEDSLYGELAISLGIEKDDVKRLVEKDELI